MTRSQREGVALILLAAAAYACLPILTKTLYSTSDMQPLDVLTWRFIIATPMIWLFLRLLRAPQPEMPLPRSRLLALGMLFAAAAVSAFIALQRVSASLFTLILYAYPAMVALLGLAGGERLPRRAWFALALTLVGVVLTVPDLSTVSGDPLGIFLCVLNGFLYALYLVFSGRLLRGRTRGVSYASAWSVTGALLPLLVSVPLREVRLPPHTEAWLILLALALFSTVISFFAIYAGIQRLGASRASILSAMEPVFTVLLAMLVLGERMTAVQWVGGALILVSVIVLEMRPSTPEIAPLERSASLAAETRMP